MTPSIRNKLVDLVNEFTTTELMDLRVFLRMACEVRELQDGHLEGLRQVLVDKGNPNHWNLAKLVEHEQKARERIRKARERIRAGQCPDIFPNVTIPETGTMVPPWEDLDSRMSELYRRKTRPQPGDE